jgi:radical SAM superfamily enzyme YgiQ (UPF0313 family)
MQKIKVGLIHSPESSISKHQNFGLKFSPVWAYVLTSYIEALGHKSELFDMNNASLESITACDIFFFSGINQDIDSLIDASLFCKAKFPDTVQFIGGPITWSFDKANELERLKNFDYICIGDGEILTPLILNSLVQEIPLPRVIKESTRFNLENSLVMSAALIDKTAKNYYGGVIEVSRGCPFLCEFCDIRIMPDNNRNHSMVIDKIIKELNIYRLKGINNFQLACDNFIGDLSFSKELTRAIILNNKKHNWAPSFYTWLTINFGNYPELMRDMRLAGVDIIFIGIESFNNNTLLETAKLQNTKVQLVEAIRNIQSYGFIVAAGLIFGFDGDGENVADQTLEGVLQSALLSGEPALLTALPGTPLYRRMRLSGRLRTADDNMSLARQKYITNVKYLLPASTLINNYIKFYKVTAMGKFHYKRLKAYYEIITRSPNFVNDARSSSLDVKKLLKQIFNAPELIYFYIQRFYPIIGSRNIIYFFKALLLVARYRVTHKIPFKYFMFWLYIWTNSLSSKYRNLKSDDFDIESVPDNYDIRNIIPAGYREMADEEIPENKINAQYKATISALEKIIKIKAA